MHRPRVTSRLATALVVLGYLCLAAAVLSLIANVLYVWPRSSHTNMPSLLIAASMAPELLGLTCGGLLMFAAAEALESLRRIAERLEESTVRRDS